MCDLLGEDALAGGPGVDAGVGHPDGPRRVPDRHLHVRAAALDVVALQGGSNVDREDDFGRMLHV